jgi:Xaa-Pro aminopeptidase
MPFAPDVMSLRAQAEVRNRWLRERLEHVLPALMARTGLDMWLVIAREYNEDPVVLSLLPQPVMSARRRTILVFTRRPDGSVERLTVSRYGLKDAQGDLYATAWNPDAEPDQYAALARLVAERDPQSIGLNMSSTFAFGDGLSHSEYERLTAALGEPFAPRLTSAENLCVGWLERRTAAELTIYPQIVAMGHDLIETAYSRQVITPGVTTTDDVAWWMRQTLEAHGLAAWFQPTVEIQAPGQSFAAADHEQRTLIQPGDLLHCDVGFVYLGLCTDHQQHAYVLREGEREAPAGLVAALKQGNRLQDILMATIQPGRTGNEVLAAALAQAREEGLTPSIYTHPLGYHGHAAGPTIGLWDRQDGVPGDGDYPLFDETAYSIELNVRCPVAEWDGQEVRIALEEDAVLSGGRMRWLAGRQEALHVI